MNQYLTLRYVSDESGGVWCVGRKLRLHKPLGETAVTCGGKFSVMILKGLILRSLPVFRLAAEPEP